MRLLFIRHGDPDYTLDSLTDTGKKEAELLVPRLMKEEIHEFFVSPLGRARATARPTLEALGRTAAKYDLVTEAFDALLAAHGYRRSGLLYRAERPNKDTLAFFCHFGVTCVLLSHLMNCSPMVLWQGICLAPSSITTVYTEERRPGIAAFRTAAFGDVSHLYAGQVLPSFSARFCEVYGDGTRVD